MLALLRVFLDPRLYGPSPTQRIQNSGRRGRRNSDYDGIPEPVPAFAEVYSSEPRRAPAAAVAQSVPSTYSDVTSAHAASVNSAVPAYAQAYEPAYQQAQSPQPYTAAQTYADGSIPAAQPYVSSETSAYPAQPEQPAAPAYAGGQADVPILGGNYPNPTIS